MSNGNIQARNVSTGLPVSLSWDSGIITSLESAADCPPDLWIAPGLIDLQINGFGGVDFQQDNLTAGDLLQAVSGLRKAGCTHFLLTLITDEWGALISRLKHLRKLRAESPILQRAIAGWHVEGPFLSPEPGYCGAHPPEWMIDPTPEHIRELRNATGDDPLLITIAPERMDAIAAISLAISLGIRVSLGHTNAPKKRILQAINTGATGFTHLGNGCPQQLDRHDNILWRIFETSGLTVSLIPDQIHVSPALFRLAHKTIGANAIYYTTDAMAAAGAPPGHYRLGRLELEVGDDQIVRMPGKQNLAGSALTPIHGLFRAAEMLGCPWTEVWPRFSSTPARFMGLPCGIHPGQPADFCLLEVEEPNQFRSITVYAHGETSP